MHHSKKALKKEIDQSREGFTWLKILQLFRLFLPKNTRTLTTLKKFSDFDPVSIQKKYGIKIEGVILDVDETISLNRGKILQANINHLKKLLKHGIKIVLMSNMVKTSRYDVLDKRIKVMTNFAPKPEPGGFKKAIKYLDVPKKNIVMIGDNYITDGGAIRLGIPFVRVRPIQKKHRTFPETIHNAIRKFFIVLAKIYQKK